MAERSRLRLPRAIRVRLFVALMARVAHRRAPDFLIGPQDAPYMRRWWVIPRNRFFNVYLHHVRHDDDDRALHDHPWPSCSILLLGGYREIVPAPGADPAHGPYLRKWREPGAITFRRASAPHRLEIDPDLAGGDPCWSLFITGPVIRQWGFHCPRGWRHWKDFVAARNPGEVGAGCGETEPTQGARVVGKVAA